MENEVSKEEFVDSVQRLAESRESESAKTGAISDEALEKALRIKAEAAEQRRKNEVQLGLTSISNRKTMLSRKNKKLLKNFYGIMSQYERLNRELDRMAQSLGEDEDIESYKTRLDNEFIILQHVAGLLSFLSKNRDIDELPLKLLSKING
jgi:hypothetical protein